MLARPHLEELKEHMNELDQKKVRCGFLENG
jgi:hypothetical protein